MTRSLLSPTGLAAVGLAAVLTVGASQAAPVAIPIDQPVGGYTSLTFGPMRVATDGNAATPLSILDTDPLASVDLAICGNFQFGGCGASLLLTFDDPIASLTFKATQTSTLANFTVAAYADPGANVGTDPADATRDWDSAEIVGEQRRITIFADTPIQRVFINNTTDFAAFGAFSYEPAAVPAPPAVMLALSALGAFGLLAVHLRRA